MGKIKKLENDYYIDSSGIVHGQIQLNNVINNLPVYGTIVPVSGVKVNYGTYLVIDKLLIIVASITATSSIPIYSTIMSLSEGNKNVGGNCYMYSTNNTNCYINKNNGNVAIYQAGGLPAGATLTWAGIYALIA